MVITDEFLEKLKGPKSTVYINNVHYKVTDDKDFSVGDMVLDREDGMHGKIDMIMGDKAAVRDGCVVELGIPFSRLIKLKKINENNEN
jgi:hypothetical protein